jgi:heavy metal translocating P-type ATPase
MLARLGVAIFLSMNVMVFAMALWSQDLYGTGGSDDPSPLAPAIQGLFRYLSLFFSLPVLWLLGGPLFDNAVRGARQGTFSMDLLLLGGVAAAYAYSIVSVLRDDGRVYFEVGCTVLVLVTLGRWIEAIGKQRTTEALTRLQRLLPDTVRRLDEQGETMIALAEVHAGDRLRLLPGERIPCDGIIRRGTAHVDEQLLTGESTLISKRDDDRVLGGTVNVDGDLIIEVSAPPNEGTLARFVALVLQCLRSRGSYEQLAGRAAAVFLPSVVLLAVAGGVWHGWKHGMDAGLMTSLAVCLIACPCALGIATPLALWSALGNAAERQLLFRDASTLERLGRVSHVFFDKTGTLTTGTPRVVRLFLRDPQDEAEVLTSLEWFGRASNHPYSAALLRHAMENGRRLANGDGTPCAHAPLVTLHAGRGLSIERPEKHARVILGSLAFMNDQGMVMSAALEHAATAALGVGDTVVAVGWGQKVRAIAQLAEEPRPECSTAIARLREMGLHVAVLTGDHPQRAAAFEKSLGLPTCGGLLPADKLQRLHAIRAHGHMVAMVGDGLNDAPALAACDVGFAMGCGADLTRAAAAVCVLNNNLERIPDAIGLARQTVSVIKQNLFWAFVYNTLGIGLALSGHLNPVWAAGAMAVSSALVVGNSLRLRGEAPDR